MILCGSMPNDFNAGGKIKGVEDTQIEGAPDFINEAMIPPINPNEAAEDSFSEVKNS